MPSPQVAISALFSERTTLTIFSVKDFVEPVRIRMAIRLPMKPQTRMTQATVSSIMTLSEVSANPPMKPVP